MFPGVPADAAGGAASVGAFGDEGGTDCGDACPPFDGAEVGAIISGVETVEPMDSGGFDAVGGFVPMRGVTVVSGGTDTVAASVAASVRVAAVWPIGVDVPTVVAEGVEDGGTEGGGGTLGARSGITIGAGATDDPPGAGDVSADCIEADGIEGVSEAGAGAFGGVEGDGEGFGGVGVDGDEGSVNDADECVSGVEPVIGGIEAAGVDAG